ncbi:MAG TPA: DUF302 domain-containing protein [Proteobacteria bacterium]|nr:hypothetical protein BMS3Abin14_01560 [bacterium BMS3Abin14]HDL53288.1 DUF302 domain-containing protein [Pseudomonadota bacterium]
MIEEKYFFKTVLDLPYEEAKRKVTEALSGEGFGILTEIDVKATLNKKLDVDFRKYVILGACNPSLAFQTLKNEEQIGLMLPCNVVVQEGKDGTTIVSAINPEVAMKSVQNPDIAPVAGEVSQKLKNVIGGL